MFKSAFAAAIAVTCLAATSVPSLALGYREETRKFLLDTCATALKQPVMPASAFPVPWCIDPASGEATHFMAVSPRKGSSFRAQEPELQR